MYGRLAAAVLTTAMVALAVASVAAASCNPGRSSASGNWHAGWDVPPPSGTCLDGSSAVILVYQPYVHSQNATAWTMLYNHSSSSYGQVGYWQGASSRNNFTESSTSLGGFHQRLLPASPLGSGSQYEITFSSDAFHYFINGSNVATDSGTGYTGCYGQQSGEVTDSANQMPGGSSDHVWFVTAQVRRQDTESWINANGNIFNDAPSWYSSTKVSSTELDIFDRACTS
jgi:hypothetical protein